jgi:hypothetical protein
MNVNTQVNATDPPAGQGIWAESLVPGRLRATVRRVAWGLQDAGRGSARTCAAGSTTLRNYTSGWSADPPRGDPLGPPETRLLLPYGATNLRIGELPMLTESVLV